MRVLGKGKHIFADRPQSVEQRRKAGGIKRVMPISASRKIRKRPRSASSARITMRRPLGDRTSSLTRGQRTGRHGGRSDSGRKAGGIVAADRDFGRQAGRRRQSLRQAVEMGEGLVPRWSRQQVKACLQRQRFGQGDHDPKRGQLAKGQRVGDDLQVEGKPVAARSCGESRWAATEARRRRTGISPTRDTGRATGGGAGLGQKADGKPEAKGGDGDAEGDERGHAGTCGKGPPRRAGRLP